MNLVVFCSVLGLVGWIGINIVALFVLVACHTLHLSGAIALLGFFASIAAGTVLFCGYGILFGKLHAHATFEYRRRIFFLIIAPTVVGFLGYVLCSSDTAVFFGSYLSVVMRLYQEVATNHRRVRSSR